MLHRRLLFSLFAAREIILQNFTWGFLQNIPSCKVISLKNDPLSTLSVNQKQGAFFSSTIDQNKKKRQTKQEEDLLQHQNDFPFNSAAFDEVEKELNISKSMKDHIEYGLDDVEVQKRQKMYGKNTIPPKPRKSLIALFSEQFEDRLVQILLMIAFVSTISSINEMIPLGSLAKGSTFVIDQTKIMQSFIEPGIILLILLINAAIGVWQQSSALDSMDALKKLQPQVATVLRSNKSGEGKWIDRFDASFLVPGDIIMLKAGNMVPADIKLIHLDSTTFTVDESSLTGESISVQKIPLESGSIHSQLEKNSSRGITIADQNGMLFSGTTVTQGFALGIVVRTGLNTELGKIQLGVISVDEMKTPLEQKLDKFAEDLARIIASLCFAVWLISIPRFNDPNFASFNDGAFYYGKVCVALGVAAIPEGLPAVITLVLSLGTKRLAERNVIVRKLPCIETLGCTTVICTDKTGTLTTNQMSVVSLLTFDNQTNENVEIIESIVTGSSFKPDGKIYDLKDGTDGTDQNTDFRVYSDIISVCFGCNNAKLVRDNDVYSVIGEPTEGALLCVGEKLGPKRYDSTSNNDNVDMNKRAWEQCAKRCATLDFDRDRKSMSVIYKFHCEKLQRSDQTAGTSTNNYKLLVKGAPNLLLERCSKIQLRDGTIKVLTPELQEEVKKKISLLSDRPLRCLLLAVRDIGSNEAIQSESFKDFIGAPENYSVVESNLTIVGVVGMKDPVRSDSASSIERCRQAGVRLIVISGDARETTSAVARELKVLQDREDNTKTFTGTEFFAKPKSEQISLLSKGNIVFSRTEPIHKQIIVKRLQSIEEIVAMSGDGVNDAPALRQASIGVAMGSGSEIAKEASDMILADDSFATIVNGIEEGRFIFNNIEAFINFLISCNISEVLAVFFATIMGLPPMLSALQLLWINLATDGPAAVALGFNPTTDDVMKATPRDANKEIITPWQLVRYFAIGFYIAIATVSVYVHQFMSHGISFNELSHWTNCAQWADSNLCETAFGPSTMTLAQTLAMSTIITAELLKALSTISVNQSILKVSPFQNPYLIAGVSLPFIIHLIILYNPMLSTNFGVMPLSLEQWTEVILWSMPIILVDEVLKYIERNLQ